MGYDFHIGNHAVAFVQVNTTNIIWGVGRIAVVLEVC